MIRLIIAAVRAFNHTTSSADGVCCVVMEMQMVKFPYLPHIHCCSTINFHLIAVNSLLTKNKIKKAALRLSMIWSHNYLYIADTYIHYKCSLLI